MPTLIYVLVILAVLAIAGFLLLLYFASVGGALQKQFDEGIIFPCNFSTPEGAVLCLEEAYRTKDIDEAMACKDFEIEAKLMLEKLGTGFDQDAEVLNKTREVLELSYRKHLEEEFPQLDGVETRFLPNEPYREGIVVANLIKKNRSGMAFKEKLLVAQTETGWRVLNPL